MDDFQRISVTLRGCAPLMMHNGRLANPLDPAAQALKAVSKGNAKDQTKISRAEFMGSLYLDENLAPCIPVDMVLAVVIAGAKKHKLGPQAKAAIFDVAGVETYPLQYKGPRTAEELYALEEFRDVRGVRVQQSRVMRTRPIFRKWSVEIELDYDSSVISREDIINALTAAGKLVGVGDYRPRFGRFTVEGV